VDTNEKTSKSPVQQRWAPSWVERRKGTGEAAQVGSEQLATAVRSADGVDGGL